MSSLQLVQATPFSATSPKTHYLPLQLQSLESCSNMSELKQYHSHIIKLGLSTNNDAMGRVIKFCAVSKHGDLGYALKAFDTIPQPDAFIYNTVMRGYLHCRFPRNCIHLYTQMLANSVFPNNFTLPCVLGACCHGDDVEQGRQVHAHVLKFGYSSHVNNRFHEAFDLFNRMRAENVVLDKFVAASMLSACTGLGALEQGRWIHSYIEKNGIELDTKLATTVIDMYCKCGCLEKALEVFHGLPCRGVSSWNCMIGGLAMHGNGEAAIELFMEMERKAVAPDNITFVNVLNACAHSGVYASHHKHGIQYRYKLA
ncbi:hypothetical protein Q3G72_032326 [Acer saccharum]|nr:hypothetical protein Q3G72_032326 [Acer saccharum]